MDPNSIVDYLKSTGKATDFASRSALATQYGISGYTGSASQNTQLLNSLKSGAAPKTTTTPPAGGGSSVPDLGDNEVIGAGPNAGMTVGQLKAYDAANPDRIKNSQNNASLTRAPGISDAEWARQLAQSPFLVADPNSSTGYRTPTNQDYTDYQKNYVPTLSQDESTALAAKYGINASGADFTGLTMDQAIAKAAAKKQELLGGATLDKNNSFYSVTQLGNVKKAIDGFALGLKGVSNDPWKTPEDKGIATKDLIATTTTGIASNFKDPQSFIDAYNTNPDLKNLLNDYINAGGSVADISQRIDQNSQGNVLGNNQDVSTYLLNGKTSGLGDNVYTKAADSYLNPTKTTTIDEINRIAKVPNDYIDLYYGTPEKVGVFQKIKEDAQTSIDNLTKAYNNSSKTTSDQFDLQVQKNTFDAQANVADLEQKRLQAKNYLTEKLASIGALITTGAAPEALANLDARYETQKSAAMTELSNTNAMLLSKKAETLNSLSDDLSTKIQTIKNQTNKSASDIEKEILKEKQSAQKSINTEIDQYNTKANSAYKDFLNTANKSSQQYIKEFLKTASGGSTDYSKEFATGLAALIKPKTTKAPAPTGGDKKFVSGGLSITGNDIAGGEQKLNSSRGADGFVDPDVYKAMYDKWVNNKGLLKDFLAKYPIKNYVNPANTTLPSFLRPASSKAKSASDRKL